MTKDDLRQIITEIADDIYNKPNNKISSAKSIKSAAILNSIEELLTEVLYRLDIVD